MVQIVAETRFSVVQVWMKLGCSVVQVWLKLGYSVSISVAETKLFS